MKVNVNVGQAILPNVIYFFGNWNETSLTTGIAFVGQAVLPAKSASGLSSHLRVPGKLLKLEKLYDIGLERSCYSNFQ